jgi:MFS family permease
VPQRASSLAPFKNSTFRALWIATLISNLGGLIQNVAAAWMMTTISDSKSMVALVQASATLPLMFFSLPAGALADNLDRRRIMLVAQTFMLVVSAVLAVFAYGGLLTPWLLLTFTFLVGCGRALNNPSWQTSLGDIVVREELPSAVALNSMSINMMRSIGPAIGGAIVATAGAAMAFAVNAVSYVLLIFELARWAPPKEPRTLPREATGRAISAGVRYVMMSPNILKVMFRTFLFGLSAVAALALLPLIARDLINGGPLTYGILLGAFGFGAVAGALASGGLRERFGNETLVRLTFVTFALCMGILAISRDMWISCAALLIAGACWVLSLSLFNVTVQLSTPRWVVGRALALYQAATFGGMSVGSWLWGSIAQAHGSPMALGISALFLLAGSLVGVFLTLPAFGDLDLDPLNRFNEPEIKLDLRSRSGPVQIMVDYRIDNEDIPAFLAAMTERRRIRIRDGAQQWALLRDMEDPEIWTESYHVPTWVDYIRHHQRRTNADQEVYDVISALHKGPERPRIHRMIERQTVPRRDDAPIKHHPEID